METPAHLTEGVWDSAETGNNHSGEVVKVIERNADHVEAPITRWESLRVPFHLVADNNGDGGGF